MARHNEVIVEHSQTLADTQDAIRQAVGRRPFNPYEFFDADNPARSRREEGGPFCDLVGFGVALFESAWSGGQIAVSILDDHKSTEEVSDDTLGHLGEGYGALRALTEKGHFLAGMDAAQCSEVLRGVFSAAHRQTASGVHKAWHHLHPDAPTGCERDGCFYLFQIPQVVVDG